MPGQVYFNATRKLVLTGADGVIFVADSQRDRMDANLESLENLANSLPTFLDDVRKNHAAHRLPRVVDDLPKIIAALKKAVHTQDIVVIIAGSSAQLDRVSCAIGLNINWIPGTSNSNTKV